MKTSIPPVLGTALLALLLTAGAAACSDSDTPSTSLDTDQSDLGTDDPSSETDPAPEADPTAEIAPSTDGE